MNIYREYKLALILKSRRAADNIIKNKLKKNILILEN